MADKIYIDVVAGIIPGEPIVEHSRRFTLTAKEFEDREATLKFYGYALEYMRSLQDPRRVNWVRCDWIYL